MAVLLPELPLTSKGFTGFEFIFDAECPID
jgi:hypothetical protein